MSPLTRSRSIEPIVRFCDRHMAASMARCSFVQSVSRMAAITPSIATITSSRYAALLTQPNVVLGLLWSHLTLADQWNLEATCRYFHRLVVPAVAALPPPLEGKFKRGSVSAAVSGTSSSSGSAGDIASTGVAAVPPWLATVRLPSFRYVTPRFCGRDVRSIVLDDPLIQCTNSATTSALRFLLTSVRRLHCGRTDVPVALLSRLTCLELGTGLARVALSIGGMSIA